MAEQVTLTSTPSTGARHGQRAMAVLMVVLMIAVSLAPMATALGENREPEPAPDLRILDSNVNVQPAQPVQGVQVHVGFVLENIGDQKAFAVDVWLLVDETMVDSLKVTSLDINGTAYLSLNWTPVDAGQVDLKLRPWYSETSKLDLNWDNNNWTRRLDVLSRPDAQITTTDILILLNNVPNPEYVRDGDTLTVRATVRNLGTAAIESCNVSLWETQGLGGPRFIAVLPGGIIAGSSYKMLEFTWNTTNWAGKRTLAINVTDVTPRESNFANNRASKGVKIHTKEDLVFDLSDKESVTSLYKVNFFIQIEDNAVLTIEEDGNMSILQEFDDQYDIVLLGRGSLVIDGGKLISNRNCTIFLHDQSRLVITGDGSTNLRIVSDGSATVILEDCNVTSPGIEMSGGSLSIARSDIVLGRLTLSGTKLDVTGSELELHDQLVINTRTTIRDTHLLVRRVFGDFSEAVIAYPVLETYEPDTRRVVGLPPALVATSGATVDLINVSVESTVFTQSDKLEYWTDNRVAATGVLSVIYIHRYITVRVVEWSGKEVPGAHVQVLDYFKDDVKAEGDVDDLGVIRLEVVTDYIKESLSPFVGNLRVHAELGTQLSEYVRISHYKYPLMAAIYNDYELTMVLPPSGSPTPDPAHTNSIRVDQHLSGNSDRNIIIDNAVVTVEDATLFLEQEYPFQWFVLVKGARGALIIDNSILSSTFTFVCFLEDNARLVIMDGSEALNVRVVAFEQSTVTIEGSEFTGDLYATCQEVTLESSSLNLVNTRIDVTKATLNAAIWVEQSLTVMAHSIEIKGADVTNAYTASRQMGLSTLRSFVSYYGWSKLDDTAVTGNLSWFKEFSRGVNISIAGDLLTIEDSFIYADGVSIVVERIPNTNQTKVTNSWVGATSLWFVADDLRAEGTNFNRPLDDLDLRDRAWLYSVEMPGVVCRDNATAERYWYLSVHAVDGAGSDRSGALLEIISTETNRTISNSVRTDTLGRATIAILANTTDRTGDYFVGSIMFRLKYDQKQYAISPVYTPWSRVAMKSDIFREMTFAETIDSPKKDVTYLVFERIDLGPVQDLRYYMSTFENGDDFVSPEERALAWAFYNLTHPETLWTDRMRTWEVVKGESASIGILAVELINNVWEPLDSGSIRFYIVNSTIVGTMPDQYTPNPADAHRNYNGMTLSFTVSPGESGYCETALEFPDSVGKYWMYIEVEGGMYDPLPQLLKNYTWREMQVVDPRNIEVLATVQPRTVEVGSTITVSGTVRYVSDATGVNGSEITVFGQRITQQRFVSRPDGSFSIVMQAPLIPADSYTLSVLAIDTLTENNATMALEYSVIVVVPPERPDETNWLALYVVIIIVVLAAAIGGGAMIFLRRQWGKLVECGECGAFIPANTPKCPKCGVEFETDLARCSECEAWIPADSPACPVCGTPFTIEVLEKQAVVEEAAEQGKPIELVTTSTAKIPPIPLATATAGPAVDEDQTRRTRIKKRVKKRLTVTEADATIDTGAGEEAGDLYVGEGDAQQAGRPTRLPGIDIGEEQLSEDELSKLLPTEDMLKELMLTTEKPGGEAGAEAEEAPEKEHEGEKELLEEIPSTAPGQPSPTAAPPAPELEEIPTPKATRPGPMAAPGATRAPALQRLQLSGPVVELEEPGMGAVDESGEEMGAEDEGTVLKELGLRPEGSGGKPKPKPAGPRGKPVLQAKADEAEAPSEGDEGLLGDILSEPKEREAPKLCPNCGGNWILYKGGEYTCRICGEKW